MAREHDAERKPTQSLSTGLWLLKHTQGIVTTATAIGILHFRTCHVVYFTMATLATSFSAKGLKRVIKQPRPPGSRVKKTSGMPSTHSASISFMGTYIMLTSLLLPLHPSISLGSQSHDDMTRLWLALLGIAAPIAVMWSRVRLGVHTPEQTVAGAALGVFNACISFLAWNGTMQLFGTMGNTESLLAVGLRQRIGVPVDDFISRLARSTSNLN